VRFLPSLESKTAAATLRRVTAQARWRAKGQPYVADWDIERAITEGFSRVLMVYRCVDVIATNQARTDIQVRVGGRDGPIADTRDLRLLHLLNRRPNPYETAVQFRYRLSCQLLLSKQGVFVELVRSNGGGLAELHLLPAGRTAPLPGVYSDGQGDAPIGASRYPGTAHGGPPGGARRARFLDGYRVTHPDGGWTDLPPEDVLWIRKPHPTDPYMGTTPLEAAGLTADIDFYARLFNRNFMMNDGRPGGLVAVKGELNEEDARELKQRFAGGPSGAGRTTVIEADEVSWVDTATTPRDAQYVASQAATGLDLRLAFGVPESLLGNASGRTYDNAGAEEAIFWRVTEIPHCELIDGAFDALTPGGDEDDLFLVHDTSGIAPLRRDERERHAKLLQEFQAGTITLDEYREGTGQPRLDVPGSRVVWLPAGKVGVGQPADEAAAAALMGGGAQPALGAGPGLPVTSSPSQFDQAGGSAPALDPYRGGWQADGAARELDLVASGAGNNTGNGTLDPRGNGIARGVKMLELPSGAIEYTYPLPDDLSVTQLTEVVSSLLADAPA
jgi:phage portal protein BeeE